MADTSSSHPSSPDDASWLKREFGKEHMWALLPLASALGFLGFLAFYSCQLGLPELDWADARTNTAIAQLQTEAMMGTGVHLLVTNQVMGRAEAKEKGERADVVTKELVARFAWGSSAVLFGFLCLCATGLTLRIFYTVFDARSPAQSIVQGKPKTVWGFLGLVVLTYCVCLTISWEKFSCVSGGQPVNQLFDAMEGKSNALAINLTFVTNGPATNIRLVGAPEKGIQKLRVSPATVSRVRRLTAYITAGAETGFVAIAVAASALSLAIRKLNVKEKESVFGFEDHVSRGITLLQLAAVTLAVGVIEVYLLLMMASYHVAPDLTKDVQAFARAGATVTGFIYTGLLAAIFLPMAAEQRAAARKLLQLYLQDAPSDKDKDKDAIKRLRQLGEMDATSWPVIKAGIALLSPLLAGFVTKLFSSLALQF